MEQILTNAARQDEQASQVQIGTQVPTEMGILSHAFLTIEEVATLLRVNKRTVYNLIYKGTLRATKVSYHVTVIQKQDFLDMLNGNRYIKAVALPKQDGQSDSLVPHNEEKCQKDSKVSTKTKVPQALIPSSPYRHSVRDPVTGKVYDESELYTLAEICRKYDCKYRWFYSLRMRYGIPRIKADGMNFYPVEDVEKAIVKERERTGNGPVKHWYTCLEIMQIYGLGRTQIRSFAERHGVRIEYSGHCNHYLKADWEAAWKKAEMKSTSTKTKRE